MQCDRIQPLIYRFVDGELPAEIHSAVVRHLESCPECRTEVLRLQRLEHTLAAVDTPEFPPDLTALIMDRAFGTKRRASGTTIVWRDWWASATVPLRAAAVIILMVGLAVGGFLSRSVVSGSRQIAATPPTASTETLAVYGLDNLGGLPAGSLSGAYLELISTTPIGGN